jgi:nucleoside phosphorylase
MVDVTERIHPAGTMFYIGRLPGAKRRVALVEVGPGNRDAAVLTERAISFLQPEFPLELLVFVGVAGGPQSDIALGDVVVPTTSPRNVAGSRRSSASANVCAGRTVA